MSMNRLNQYGGSSELGVRAFFREQINGRFVTAVRRHVCVFDFIFLAPVFYMLNQFCANAKTPARRKGRIELDHQKNKKEMKVLWDNGPFLGGFLIK